MLFVNRGELMRAVMARGCLGHSDHEVIWFNVFSVRRKKKSRVATLGFRRPNFKIFKKPFSRLS